MSKFGRRRMSVAFIRSNESVSKTGSLVVSASSVSGKPGRGPLGIRSSRSDEYHSKPYKYPFLRKLAAMACLATFPLSAQQANTALSLQATPAGAMSSGQSQPGQAPLPNAPQVKDLPDW